LITNGPESCNGYFLRPDLVYTNTFCCTGLGTDSGNPVYVRTEFQTIAVKLSLNNKEKNFCILKLEKSDFKPALPCKTQNVESIPQLSDFGPNCFVGGWHWDDFTSDWALAKAPVQQVFSEDCSDGLETYIEEHEICVIGIGFLPEADSTTCNLFTGMPLVCITPGTNQLAFVGVASYPVGCAIPGQSIGIWEIATEEIIARAENELMGMGSISRRTTVFDFKFYCVNMKPANEIYGHKINDNNNN
jgi:hypothetical protein